MTATTTPITMTKEREEEIRGVLQDVTNQAAGIPAATARDWLARDVVSLLDAVHAERARAEAAEAQLAALREAMSAIDSAIAHETLTADGDIADRFSDGAMERLRAAVERLWGPDGDWLDDAAATAEAYTRRVRAGALREAAQRLLARHLPGGGAVMWGPAESSWRERGAIWLRDEAKRIEGGP